MSDDKKDNKKDDKKEDKKTVSSSPGRATRMRPKPVDKIEQKLKDVKEHQPHFDDMSSYMHTLLKPVDGSTMTKKPFSPAKPSSAAKPYSPAKPRPAKPPAKPAAAKQAIPVKQCSPAKQAIPVKQSCSAQQAIPVKQCSLAKPASPMDTSNQDSSFDTEMPREYPPARVRLQGSPIPFDEPILASDQPRFFPAIITPPPNGVPYAPEPPMEIVNTWECTPVEPVEVLGNGLNMFVRNTNGSYDLFSGLQPQGPPEQEDVNIREITLDDGPLVILTRDGEGNISYDPDDSVTIDIADNSLYVLNTDEGTAFFMDNEENPNGAGENMDAENMIEYLPEEMDPTVSLPAAVEQPSPQEVDPFENVGAEAVIELDPESFAAGEVAGKRVVYFVCETGHRPQQQHQQQRQPVDLREAMPVRLRLLVVVT